MKAVPEQHRKLWESAATSERGVEIDVSSYSAAQALRHALYRARNNERKNAATAMGGDISIDWDNYLIQIERLPSGAAKLRITKEDRKIVAVRPIP
jgi:hypothetical protein